MAEQRKCAKKVHDGPWYRGRPCKNRGIYGHDGQWYCASHHPGKKAERVAKRGPSKWEREWEARCKAEAERERQARIAQRHREALEKLLPMCFGSTACGVIEAALAYDGTEPEEKNQ